MIANTPSPPYYAVIFTSVRKDHDPAYEAMAQKMAQLAAQQPGYLGMESAREAVGITVSYWQDEASIKAWKQQVDHQVAQQKGRQNWYSAYQVRVARVERAYGFSKP